MKKTISIVAPDTVPLPIRNEVLQGLDSTEKANFLSKYCDASTYGIRSWKFAEELAKHFDVTLLIPDCYYPEQSCIDTSNIKFEIESYNYRIAAWNWSQELDRKLKKANFVITQTSSGSGIQNCAVLPSTVNLIVDGWSVLPLELSGQLLTHSKISRKVFWKRAMTQYSEIVTRANCLLIANEKQLHFYEGFFYGIDKHNYNSFQFSPILKVPCGVEQTTKTRTIQDSTDLRLLWLGPIQSWDYPELLLKEVINYDDIAVDFVNIRHARQPKVFNTYFKPYFERIDDISNMSVLKSNEPDLNSYDFVISLCRNWILSSYIHKSWLLDVIEQGVPVVTNSEDALYHEVDFLRDSICPVDINFVKGQLEDLRKRKHEYNVSEVTKSRLHDIFSWQNVLLPVVDYIHNF